MSEDIVFEWDEDKRRKNLDKHGIDFLDAAQVFVGDPLVLSSDHQGEARFVAIGQVRGIFLAVIYTMRMQRVRIISVRRARRNERRTYDTHLSGRGLEDPQ